MESLNSREDVVPDSTLITARVYDVSIWKSHSRVKTLKIQSCSEGHADKSHSPSTGIIFSADITAVMPRSWTGNYRHDVK